jgi:hypothetical protein
MDDATKEAISDAEDKDTTKKSITQLNSLSKAKVGDKIAVNNVS